MDHTDDKRKLLLIFASLVEKPRTDYTHALDTPIEDLNAGGKQAAALLTGVVRTNSDEVNAQAAGRSRFPELQGVTEGLGEGLSRHPDIAEEILATPDDYTNATHLDRAIGRFIYAAQLLQIGGHTGVVLAAATAQKLIEQVLTEVRARTTADPRSAAASDLNVAFEEPFRLQADGRARLQQAQDKAAKVAGPFQERKQQAQDDSALSRGLDDLITTLARKEGLKP